MKIDPPPIPDSPYPAPESPFVSEDEAVLQLYIRLRRTVWADRPDDDPMGRCICALALRLSPLITAEELVDCLPATETAFDEIDLINTMARIGFRASPMMIAPGRLDPRLTPCLILTRPGEEARQEGGAPRRPGVLFYARDEAENRVPALFDVAAGQSRAIAGDDPIFTEGVKVYVFTRIDARDPGNWQVAKATRGYSWFRSLCGRLDHTIRKIVIIGFALNVTALGGPLLILLFYDRVIGPKSNDPLIWLTLGALLVVAAEVSLRYVRSRCLGWMTSRMDYLVGTALFEKLLQLPPRMIEAANVSSHIARIKTFESVRDFFSGPVLISTLELPATALSVLTIFLLGGNLVFVPLLAMVAYIIIFLLIWRQVRQAIQLAAIESSITQQFNLEMLEKLESIRIDGMSGLWAEKHRDLSGREISAQNRLYMLGIVGEQLGSLVIGLTALLTLGIGANLIWQGELGTGALIGAMMLTWRAQAPFYSLCSLIPRFEQARNSIIQINKFMEAEREDGRNAAPIPAPVLRGAVVFSSVALRYDSTNPIFMGLTIEARPGEAIAVTGPNGSGKSSVLKLILGMQRPLMGSVRLDGFDIRQLDEVSLRKRIAYVPQQVSLFSGSIARNLRLAAPLASDEVLWQALNAAGAQEQVAALPGGLDYEVDRNSGATLGSVLVQRIGLARAYLRNSSLILIDEQPSGALRNGLDRNVSDLINNSRGQRTVVYVSARADFLRLADRVIALRPGSPPAVGSPDKIMEMEQ